MLNISFKKKSSQTLKETIKMRSNVRESVNLLNGKISQLSYIDGCFIDHLQNSGTIEALSPMALKMVFSKVNRLISETASKLNWNK